MSDRHVFLFPGQGSQAVGMGQSFYESTEIGRARFDEANQVLGRDLRKLCLEGPLEELKQTENTQPALYVVSAIATDLLRERGIQPTCVAGHSLGEYSALYAAGVFNFQTGLRLVEQRGRNMAVCSALHPGGMAAIIGLEIEPLEKVCQQATGAEGLVVVANDNAPGQVVISGHARAVQRACALAQEAGARRALPLPVSGAFHTSLMLVAADNMKHELSQFEFVAPNCLFIPNVIGRPVENVEQIKEMLFEQITSRVRWVESVQTIVSKGFTSGFEVGSGKVLAGLVRRIDKTLQLRCAGTLEEIEGI